MKPPALEVCKTQLALVYAIRHRMRRDLLTGGSFYEFDGDVIPPVLAAALEAAKWHYGIWYLTTLAEIVGTFLPPVMRAAGSPIKRKVGTSWVFIDGDFTDLMEVRHEMVGHRLERWAQPTFHSRILHGHGGLYGFLATILNKIEEHVQPLIESGFLPREVVSAFIPPPITRSEIDALVTRVAKMERDQL